jgi:Ca2+-binding RTX toxin-like protein
LEGWLRFYSGPDVINGTSGRDETIIYGATTSSEASGVRTNYIEGGTGADTVFGENGGDDLYVVCRRNTACFRATTEACGELEL